MQIRKNNYRLPGVEFNFKTEKIKINRNNLQNYCYKIPKIPKKSIYLKIPKKFQKSQKTPKHS